MIHSSLLLENTLLIKHDNIICFKIPTHPSTLAETKYIGTWHGVSLLLLSHDFELLLNVSTGDSFLKLDQCYNPQHQS
jgi:hypothetical protein